MMFSSTPPGRGTVHHPPLTTTTVGWSNADGMMNTVALKAPGAVGRTAIAGRAGRVFFLSASITAGLLPRLRFH
jgi:hypothetical protein